MKFLQHSYKLTKSYSSFNLFREFGIMLKNSVKPALDDCT